MKKAICHMLVFIILIATYSFAAQPDKVPERANYQKELEKLKKEKPSEYEKMKNDFVFMAQLFLAELGYWTGPFDTILDEKTKNALKAYQKKRNIPETGDPLSFDTIERMESDMKTFEYHPVYLPSFYIYTASWDRGYVSASGTWILSNEKIGWPEQSSNISCDRGMNRCTEATAIVSGEGSDRYLALDVDTYEIERWDDHEIVTKPRQLACVRYVRRINRLQKSVTGIRSTISNEDMCKGVESKEFHMTLTDGSKVYWDLAQEQRKKWRQLLNISPSLFQSLEHKKEQKTK